MVRQPGGRSYPLEHNNLKLLATVVVSRHKSIRPRPGMRTRITNKCRLSEDERKNCHAFLPYDRCDAQAPPKKASWFQGYSVHLG